MDFQDAKFWRLLEGSAWVGDLKPVKKVETTPQAFLPYIERRRESQPTMAHAGGSSTSNGYSCRWIVGEDVLILGYRTRKEAMDADLSDTRCCRWTPERNGAGA